MSLKLFVTGTDTEVGKTYISIGILKKLATLGLKTIGLKPIASGGFYQNGRLYNEDAISLQQHATIPLDYSLINPFCFEPPIAPHLAAKEANISLSVKSILESLEQSFQKKADVYIIEGAGGWFVPFNALETIQDLIIEGQFQVILVVGIKLGCINHALLTQEAILKSKVPFLGWIANIIDPNVIQTDGIIETLTSRLTSPLLGQVAFNEPSEKKINFSQIIGSNKFALHDESDENTM